MRMLSVTTSAINVQLLYHREDGHKLHSGCMVGVGAGLHEDSGKQEDLCFYGNATGIHCDITH